MARKRSQQQHRSLRHEPTRWNLFLDESGNFSDPDDEVVVAGLLIRADLPGNHPSQIRAALQVAAPDLPWPVKASEFNRPVVFAIANQVGQRAKSGEGTFSRIAYEIVTDLTLRAPNDVESVKTALASARRLPYEPIARLDAMAQQNWARYQVLRAAADGAVAAIGRCIGSLARTENASGQEAGDATLFVACGETRRGECARQGETDTETSRYLELLRWVVARAADVLARRPGDHELHLYVLDRDVSDTILGVRVRTRLHYRHVVPIARDVGQLCQSDRSGATVTVKLDAVAQYDDRVHAALVLADFVANRARRGLRPNSSSLRAAETRIISEVPCRVRSGDPAASHLAAAGFCAGTDRACSSRKVQIKNGGPGRCPVVGMRAGGGMDQGVHEMNLVDAFREIGPVESDDTTVVRRRGAATVIFGELSLLSQKIWTRFDVADREDVASRVLFRLMNNGPRGVRHGDPATEAAVRAYLRAALKNGLRDLLRRRKHTEMPEDFDPADPALGPDERASQLEAHTALEWAQEEMFNALLPELASRTRAGKALIETVQQLRAIAAGRLTVQELVGSECAGDNTPEAVRRARNRLDQRFSRAFARIHEAIEALADQRKYRPEQIQAFREVLASLRLRQ